MSLVIPIGGRRYIWDPTKSTPDWPKPFAEMDEVVRALKAAGAETIIDFGCGKCRNAAVLARHFKRVYLVEVQKNMEFVRDWISMHRFKSCTAVESEEFRRLQIKAGGALVSFVLHTLPTVKLRRQTIDLVSEKLVARAPFVVVVPAHDVKYRDKYIKGAVVWGDGIVRLFPDGTFSFYKDYSSRDELEEFLKACGLQVEQRVPGDHRYVLITRTGFR
jgi:hypothetical protein